MKRSLLNRTYCHRRNKCSSEKLQLEKNANGSVAWGIVTVNSLEIGQESKFTFFILTNNKKAKQPARGTTKER